MLDSPELASCYGFDNGTAGLLDDRSLAAYDARLARVKQDLNDLHAALPAGRDSPELRSRPADKLTYDLYLDQLTGYASAFKHRSFLMCCNQLENPAIDYPQVLSWTLPAGPAGPTVPPSAAAGTDGGAVASGAEAVAAAAGAYISRLRAAPRQLQDVEGLLRQGVSEGRVCCEVSLQGVSEQLHTINKLAACTLESCSICAPAAAFGLAAATSPEDDAPAFLFCKACAPAAAPGGGSEAGGGGGGEGGYTPDLDLSPLLAPLIAYLKKHETAAAQSGFDIDAAAATAREVVLREVVPAFQKLSSYILGEWV
jgi:hypothetical protein